MLFVLQLNQDILENTFGVVRAMGGSWNNPGPFLFVFDEAIFHLKLQIIDNCKIKVNQASYHTTLIPYKGFMDFLRQKM